VTILPSEHRSGHGEPLVLLHGLAGAARIWQPVLDRLETHHDVIAITLAGHLCGPPWADGSRVGVSTLADSLEERLEALGLKRPHLAGNSLGGWMSLELARRGRARSVTAISPAGAWDPRVGVGRLIRRAALARRAMATARLQRWRVLRSPRARRALFGIAMTQGDRMPWMAAAGFLEDAVGCTVFDELVAAIAHEGPIEAPVTVPADCRVRIAWGSADRVIPFEPYGRLMLEAVPAAELLVVDGVGHIPMYDAPDLVADTILDVTLGRARALA
jgi:pimeloyl-ACP methyl ester carboxylesterase